MDIIVANKGDRSRNATEEAGGMEVELTAETEEAKRVQHETKITSKNPGTSMSVGNGDMFEKTLAEIDEELGKNVAAAAGILGSLTKTKDTKSAGDCFEFKGGKIDGVKARASGDTKGMGPSPDEEVMVGSTMGLGTYAKTEEDSFNTGPLKVTNVKKPSQAKKPLLKNNTTPKITRQNRRHNHSGDFSENSLEGKENDGFSPKSTKGTWKRLNREATNTVAMEGGSMEEGPKRKLLPPLGETDPNRDQDSNLMHMILMIAWSIWRNRNERRYGGKNLAAAVAIYGTAMTINQSPLSWSPSTLHLRKHLTLSFLTHLHNHPVFLMNKHTMAEKMNPNPLELKSSPPTVFRPIKVPSLGVGKDSHKIKKPPPCRPPVIIHETSASMVQRLSCYSGDGDLVPVARLASIVKTNPSKKDR
ncbi:hypothetical protein CFP56_024376 [Quercus suber]|uniref:Uncharacterized protein n=1 Tax=Quercus suber TaxID=58331 RepID=A0AAW0MBC3_QUESU